MLLDPEHLELFEQAVFAPSKGHFNDAVKTLHQILANYEKTGGDVHQSQQQFFYSRLADAISALLLDRQFELSLESYQLLCASHFTLASVFASTSYQNADHIISQLADISDINQLRFDNLSCLMKCLLSYSLDSEYQLDIESIGQNHPEITASLILGHLGCDLYSRASVEKRINQLLTKPWPVLGQVTPTLPMVLTTSNAWMNCSYASIPEKHQIKRNLNAMICNGLKIQLKDYKLEAATWQASERPVLLVVIEIFHSTHAMYRCFSRAIESLKNHFQVVGLAPKNCIDDEAEKLFPEMILFEPSDIIQNLQKLLVKIDEIHPDMIYYPSLGMANYSLMLANLRLAPVQCFTLGHPASSFIDSIDYVIVQEQDFTTTDIYSEKVIITGNDTSPTINRVLDFIDKPTLRESPDIIKIAVTSKHMKINHSFLDCCRQIVNRTRRQLEFHFFPGVTGYLYEFVRHEILRILPDSTIYPTTDYESYISNLDQCDLRLGTFPFGGANTNMDCFGLGIPFIILDGEQPHSRSDTAQIRQAALPDWLITDSIETYQQAALRLIEEDQIRLQLSRQMMSLYEHDFFFNKEQNQSMLFDQTLYWLYQNHPQIQQSKQRLWTLKDQGLAKN